jgi:hypothetical protein
MVREWNGEEREITPKLPGPENAPQRKRGSRSEGLTVNATGSCQASGRSSRETANPTVKDWACWSLRSGVTFPVS